MYRNIDQEIPDWVRTVLGLICFGLGGITSYLYFMAPPDDLFGIWWLILGVPMVLCGIGIVIAPTRQLTLSATGYRLFALLFFLVACYAIYSGTPKASLALIASGACIALARKKSAKY